VLDKFTALQLYTTGSAWLSQEEALKGKLVPGMYADLSVLSANYFSVDAEKVRSIESLLTIVNGKIVYAAGPFQQHDPGAPAVIPDWSPIKYYGGYQQ
jgi:predicted amidohydrolase YtcJ